MLRSYVLVLILSALFVNHSAQAAAVAKNQCGTFSKAVTGASSPGQKLKKLFTVQWKYVMTEYPEFATMVGYPGQDDRLTDNSLGAIARRQTEARCLLQALLKIPRKALSTKDQLNFDLAKASLEENIESDQFHGEYLAVNQLGGVQSDFVELLTAMPKTSAKDLENMLSRVEKFPTAVANVEVLLREGIKSRIMGIKMFMPKVVEQIDGVTTAKVEDSPLYKVFTDLPPSISKEDQSKAQTRAAELIQSKVYPALHSLRDLMIKEYIPQARETIAWSSLPNGAAWYAFSVRAHTTTKKTPDELHQVGLEEVKRITAAMEEVKKQVRFKGDLKAFNQFLLKDKQFYYTNAEDLINGYRQIAKRIDPELIKMFKTIPRLPYGIKPVPEFKANSAPGAYYESGTLEGGRPGYFVANTYDLSSRPKWDMETLTFHEAVPGHHFQISLAQELGDIPEFRKYGNYTAYAEGWALYAESLGEEMGFYKDPYSMYGHLSDEMMRAVRLVVDTGMHAKGWTKQQALDFYRSNLPATDIESEIEINRYLTWPGQALAYKVGQLKIKELREYAKNELGDKFDIREFHDQVLGHGALPMNVLEQVIKDWTKSQKKTRKAQVKA